MMTVKWISMLISTSLSLTVRHHITHTHMYLYDCSFFPYVSVFNEILVFQPCDKIEYSFQLNIDDDKVEESSEELTIILENIDQRNNIVLRNGTIVVMDDGDRECCISRQLFY